MSKCREKVKALLWFLLVFLGLWTILGVAQEAESVAVEKWALVVGVAEYPDLPGHDLTYTVIDAQAIYDFLIGPGGLEENHVKLLLNDRSTLTGVRGGLGWLKKQAQPDDLVIFYFSGHGYQGKDDNGDEKDGIDEFLVLYDTQRDMIESTALRDDEIAAWISSFRTDYAIFILDVGGDFEVPSGIGIAAAEDCVVVYEDDNLGHGVFTYFLLRGLGFSELPVVEGLPPTTRLEADVDGDGVVTVREIRDFVQQKVLGYTELKFGHTQQPQFFVSNSAAWDWPLFSLPEEVNRLPVAIFIWEILSPEGTRLLVKPNAGDQIRFDASASTDPGGEIVKYEWDWESDETWDEETAYPTIEHCFIEVGTYQVTLRVTDNDGLTDETTQTIVIEHHDLIQADFTFQVVDEALHKFHLDARGSIDTMGTIVRYEWDWNGDGIYDTAVQVAEMMHRFDGEGPYKVILTIVDDQGNRASCAKEVGL